MSFTLTCNQCGHKQELNDINPRIIIDIANENFNEPESDYILITCSNCHNTYEY